MKKIVKLKSCAKINLGLEVLSKRDDGYHNVDMIMQSLDLYDVVSLRENKCSKVRVFCSRELDCKEEDNITYKAAKKFLKYVGVNDFFVDIHIEKNIPVCAGLAGGSSNAAAVLVGLNSMLGTNLSIDELVQIGQELGADVPFCIRGGTMRATGIGTSLEAVKNNLKYFVIVVKPDISISTKDAYGRIDIFNNTSKGNKVNNILIGLSTNNVKFLSESIFNDLERSLTDEQKEKIEYIKRRLITLGALSTCMSGSGPSVYGIFDDEILVNKCLRGIRTEYEESFLCRPVNYGVKTITK